MVKETTKGNPVICKTPSQKMLNAFTIEMLMLVTENQYWKYKMANGRNCVQGCTPPKKDLPTHLIATFRQIK